MNNEFQEKLHLYAEGKLNKNEAAEIESEIDKFNAISDYLNNDEEAFFNELKQQIPEGKNGINKPAKLMKRRINLRIIMLTAASVLSILIFSISLYILSSNITTSLFGLDHEESYIKRESIVQLLQMFHPQYDSHGSGVQTLPFAQQNYWVSLDNTVGRTIIDETEINVRYSFGNPVRTEITEIKEPPPTIPIEDFSIINNHEPNPTSSFKVLENAPQGTKANIFIEFNKAITPQQIQDNFINQIDNAMDITPLAAIGSKYVIGNPSYYQFTPVYPYDSNNQTEGNDLKQNQYVNMDNQAHTESFIGNLNLIKNNQSLLQVLYYNDISENINIDQIIEHVENNGIEYVGMYISADSKELLKLKDNPLIHCMRVENIVVW